jgi:ATP-dependent exoDNAse (exonuclease V) beta subunit
MWKDDQQVGGFVLTWLLQTDRKDAIRVCTIHKFKGLERPVVIMSELDKAHHKFENQLVNIGLSRGRNHVIILGQLPKPTEAQKGAKVTS